MKSQTQDVLTTEIVTVTGGNLEKSPNRKIEIFLEREGAIFGGHVGAEPSFFWRHERFLRRIWRVGACEFRTLSKLGAGASI